MHKGEEEDVQSKLHCRIVGLERITAEWSTKDGQDANSGNKVTEDENRYSQLKQPGRVRPSKMKKRGHI